VIQNVFESAVVMQTGAGWLTIAFGLALAPAFFFWRFPYRGKKLPGRVVVCLVFLFLFFLIQWASWYE
jgi:hypothetical protein